MSFRNNPPLITRREGLLQAVALGLAGWPGWGQASSSWPQKPIQLIVPWPAGGGTDLSIRVLAEEAGQRLGQAVVVINRPGAAGTMVAPLLKAAAPDGQQHSTADS